MFTSHMCICHQSIITRVTLVMSKATIISDKCKLSSAMERRQTLGLRGWSAHHLHDRSLSLHGSPEVADFQLQRRPHRPHRPLPAPAQVSLVSCSPLASSSFPQHSSAEPKVSSHMQPAARSTSGAWTLPTRAWWLTRSPARRSTSQYCELFISI